MLDGMPTAEVDEIAWAFDPDRDRWARLGFDSFEMVQAWVSTGGTYTDAVRCCGPGNEFLLPARTALAWRAGLRAWGRAISP